MVVMGMNTGAACPGLIEAPFFCLAPQRILRRIPGQPAPASLKLERGGEIGGEEKSNTGAACPGLIEAGSRSRRIAGCSARIPGQPAPASLKHLDALPLRVASDQNTGAACPGLIEAALTWLGGKKRSVEYRGSLPRPH